MRKTSRLPKIMTFALALLLFGSLCACERKPLAPEDDPNIYALYGQAQTPLDGRPIELFLQVQDEFNESSIRSQLALTALSEKILTELGGSVDEQTLSAAARQELLGFFATESDERSASEMAAKALGLSDEQLNELMLLSYRSNEVISQFSQVFLAQFAAEENPQAAAAAAAAQLQSERLQYSANGEDTLCTLDGEALPVTEAHRRLFEYNRLLNRYTGIHYMAMGRAISDDMLARNMDQAALDSYLADEYAQMQQDSELLDILEKKGATLQQYQDSYLPYNRTLGLMDDYIRLLTAEYEALPAEGRPEDVSAYISAHSEKLYGGRRLLRLTGAEMQLSPPAASSSSPSK